jgi:hypothetical protein
VKRLIENQVVGLSVGESAIDCRVAALAATEVSLEPVRAAEAGLLPPASAGATPVFTHRGGLVMLRGAMYRAGSATEMRFAERTPTASVVAEQRRRAARVDVALKAAVTALGPDGAPAGETHEFVTRDVSLGGLALDTLNAPLLNGAVLRFTVTLPDATQIAGTGRVVRAAGSMCGVQFEQVAPADRLKLASFLVGTRAGGAPAAAPRP